ncbi:LytTR family transcriptional regulator [Roseibacterium sp. SDUM158016]|uniref:LytTR family DNA-binding domain-containing protein n=1 Tax=Roseicyclus sediminis TaxID=2980997 RepID=UPI0021D23547|nr:LytTR family DNA-binding domain-containing protein [Roseibacterium sp. SDUM158016]MCU4653333.1 LytTR family transcriptional regulator [Roseibacterium sp. SDUM158016]
MRENFLSLVTERKILVFVVLVAGFAAFGPFGTYEGLSLWSRVVFWAVIMSAIGLMMHTSVSIALPAPSLARFPRAVRLGFAAMLAAVPGVAVVIFVFRVMVEPTMGADAFPYLWFQVASIGWIACLFEYREVAVDRPTAGPAVVATAFNKRLPPGEVHDIVSISMMDHYAEVTTPRGKHLVLIRLSDAMAELEGLPGLRIHRSHWIALKHLEAVAGSAKKPVAVLSDGRELPISKTYLDDVLAQLDIPVKVGA